MRPSLVLAVLVAARVAVAEPMLAPGKAAPDATTAGAALIEEGARLGEANKYELALTKFLPVATAHPSATHDCYVALAYLRIGRLTLARLWLDAAETRGDARPAWCTGAIAKELAAALATRGFVEIHVAVEPADAEVTLADAHFRGGRAVWLPPGELEVSADLARHRPARRTVVVAAGLEVALALAPEVVSERPLEPRLPPRPRSRTPAWIATIAGGAALVTGATFHVLAARTRGDANDLPMTSAEFQTLDDRFGRERAIAIGGYVVGAAALGVGLYLFTRHGDDAAPLAVGIGANAVTATWSATW